MADEQQNMEQSPGIPDPYDMEAKRKLHPLADAKNRLEIRNGRLALTCGAKKRHEEGFCRSFAGAGTDHVGYGRCKYCGGCSTGPKTEEGKARAAQNARKHGFYSAALRPEERAVYEELVASEKVSLMDEIFLLKAKILAYLKRAEHKRMQTHKPEYRWGSNDMGNTIERYEVSTIEDKPLIRALETLGRLVMRHAQLAEGDDGDDLLDKINAELRLASQGQVQISWQTGPQRRGQEGGEE
jgi:hypothetical protein